MYGCESWTVKKVEHWRIDAFDLWCWRRLLTVPWPWAARRSNQSILKISPGCSLEGLMLKLKLQYFGHLVWRVDDSLEKTDAGRDWGQEEKGMTEDEMPGWHHWLDGREFEWTPGVGFGQGGLVCCNSWGRKESDMTERLNWTIGIMHDFHSHRVKSFFLNKNQKTIMLKKLQNNIITNMTSFHILLTYPLSLKEKVYMIFTLSFLYVYIAIILLAHWFIKCNHL